MLRRHLLAVIPAAATAIVAFVLLGPGQARAVRAARVLAASGEQASFRLSVVSRDEGRDDPASFEDVALFVDGESAPRWHGRLEAGVAEVVLERPLEAGSEISIRAGEETLAHGQPTQPVASVAKRGHARAATFESDKLTLAIEVNRGALVPPFSERVRVTLLDAGVPATQAAIAFTSVSAEPAQGKLVPNEKGEVTIDLVALAQPVLLSVEAKVGERTVAGEAMLPVSMSGIYLAPDPKDGALEIVSPGPRKVAFVSLYDERGRQTGGVVPLSVDEKGFARGSIRLEPQRETVAIVVSGEPTEKGPSTVAWPPPGASGAVEAPRLELVLDGMGDAVAREQKRIGRVRTLAIVALSLSAAFEIALLLWAGQRERKSLAALGVQLAESDPWEADGNGAEPPKTAAIGNRQVVLLASIAALVVLVFVAVAQFVVR